MARFRIPDFPNNILMKTTLQKKIFIVDDDPFWNRKMTHTLTNLGYSNIVSFESGEDCISNLHLNPVIIFLDYQMKAVDGLEVLRKAKQYFPSIDIIFCTANEDMGLAINAMKQGSFDFLIKHKVTEGQISSLMENLSMAEEEKIY
jgi:DNA-binding NtrC family response regulator